MQKKHATQTGSKAGGFKWLNLLAGCVVPLAVVAGCNGSDNGGPSPAPTATPSATIAPTAAPTPTSVACSTGQGTATFRTLGQGDFNTVSMTSGCASAKRFDASNRPLSAVNLSLEDTRSGEKRTILIGVADADGLRVNRNYTGIAVGYNETLLADNTVKQWLSRDMVVVIDAITTTSIRYHFQGTFTPSTSPAGNFPPGTGSFVLRGSASSTVTRG